MSYPNNVNPDIRSFYYVKNTQGNKTSFGAGFTPKIAEKIKTCNINNISKELAEKGIQTDFKGNNVVAWCSEQIIKIFQQLNEQYKLKLELPKKILVEDFSKLNINNPEKIATCNWLPTRLIKGSDEVIPERTLLFNTDFDWQNLDPFTEEMYKLGITSNNHFLTLPAHEFSHCSHNKHLIDITNPMQLATRLNSLIESGYLSRYQEKYARTLSNKSLLANANQFELLAEDMAQKIIRVLDINCFPTSNPFKRSSYPNVSTGKFCMQFLVGLFRDRDTRNLDKLLRKSWNGKNTI